VCVDTLPDDDLSNELRADLSIREYLTLRGAGIATVGDLAVADADALLTDAYHRETAHLRMRAPRLRKARLNAELAEAGVVIRRRADVPAVPTADVEYDVDCEWSPEERVYLWGVLRTEDGESAYVPFLDLGAADARAEYDLLVGFLNWLDEQIGADGAAGRTAAVFYYSPAELKQIRRITGAVGQSLPALSIEASPDAWIDLLPYVKKSVDSRWGCGLKVVATYGAGFEWRDEDPGGLQSQLWLSDALAGDASAQARLLAYNEDDVRATTALRHWLVNERRAQTA
jgi:predicted RecB family nuclease